ncbi:MAG TPA: tetratricopeptide repeat protein [Candidatus Limnocylindrales bacterium]|nr:tetratricopeptide repeat protein [Candidatus Limnocylindrales bacterium]
MDANLNTTSYRMHELTRDNAMQAAEAHRLAQQAHSTAPLSARVASIRGPLQVAAVLLMVVILLALGTQSAGAQALIETGTNEPYHPALVAFRMGIYYQNSGDHARAVEAFSETIVAFPMIAEAWAARGDSYSAAGAYALALADYNEAIVRAPNLVSALNMRGDALRVLGEVEQAVADYQNAIEQMPEYAAPHAGLAVAYEMLGQADEAQAEHAVYLRLVGPEATVKEEGPAKRFGSNCVKSAPSCRPTEPDRLNSTKGRMSALIDKHMDTRFWML